MLPYRPERSERGGAEPGRGSRCPVGRDGSCLLVPPREAAARGEGYRCVSNGSEDVCVG